MVTKGHTYLTNMQQVCLSAYDLLIPPSIKGLKRESAQKCKPILGKHKTAISTFWLFLGINGKLSYWSCVYVFSIVCPSPCLRVSWEILKLYWLVVSININPKNYQKWFFRKTLVCPVFNKKVPNWPKIGF